MYNRKIYLFSSLCLIGMLFAGCNKWLDVTPATRIDQNEQFQDEQGFVDALFAVYQQAAEPTGYGKDLTFGLLDVLAQRYENKANQTTATYGQLARYNYTNTGVVATVDAVWTNSYRSIAQANYILANLEGNRSVLSTQSYRIIKGEALAMRAFLHFDLLRLFAPAYENGSNADAPAIPYVEAFTVTPQEKLTISGVLGKIETDLKEAEDLLSVHTDIDQIATNQGSTALDLFLMYRQNHLNYWAVKGVLARVHLYKGEQVPALQYAREVINSQHFDFVNPNTLNTDPLSSASDLTFTLEHVFSIYVSNLKDLADNYFKSTNLTAGDASDLFSTRAKLDAQYETSQVGYGTDIRNPAASQNLWSQLSANVVFTKKFYSDNASNVRQRVIPVLKLSEMYYIAAEAAPTISEGVGYLNVVREARLLPALSTAISAEVLEAELQKEYRKEFYGEGQLWYYYKRKNVITLPDGVGNPMTAEKYTFPLPNAEIEFGF